MSVFLATWPGWNSRALMAVSGASAGYSPRRASLNPPAPSTPNTQVASPGHRARHRVDPHDCTAGGTKCAQYIKPCPAMPYANRQDAFYAVSSGIHRGEGVVGLVMCFGAEVNKPSFLVWIPLVEEGGSSGGFYSSIRKSKECINFCSKERKHIQAPIYNSAAHFVHTHTNSTSTRPIVCTAAALQPPAQTLPL